MKFYVLTIFPELINNICHESILGRAIDSEIIDVCAINIRDYTLDKHLKTDDYIYGGGNGMLMTPQPIFDSYRHILSEMNDREVTNEETIDFNNDLKRPVLLLTTPGGRTFDQAFAKELASLDNDEYKDKVIAIICGHYEGIDQRIIDLLHPIEVSIGDYVLTGGELPSCIMIDSISRLIPGVLNNDGSALDESFEDNTLEYPQYTRPAEFMGLKVPDVLLSGNHGEVDKWRKEQSLKKTIERRPDLLK